MMPVSADSDAFEGAALERGNVDGDAVSTGCRHACLIKEWQGLGAVLRSPDSQNGGSAPCLAFPSSPRTFDASAAAQPTSSHPQRQGFGSRPPYPCHGPHRPRMRKPARRRSRGRLPLGTRWRCRFRPAGTSPSPRRFAVHSTMLARTLSYGSSTMAPHTTSGWPSRRLGMAMRQKGRQAQGASLATPCPQLGRIRAQIAWFAGASAEAAN